MYLLYHPAATGDSCIPIASRASMLTLARKSTPPCFPYHAATAANAPFPIAKDSAASSTIFMSRFAHPCSSAQMSSASSTISALGLATVASPASAAYASPNPTRPVRT